MTIIAKNPVGRMVFQTGRGPRFLRRTAFVVAALLTLIASFCAVENWRGHRAWEKYRRDLKARGEQLDWAAYIPARVHDEQNFIKTPLLEAVGYRGRVKGDVVNDLVAISEEPNVRIMESKALVCNIVPGRRAAGPAALDQLAANMEPA